MLDRPEISKIHELTDAEALRLMAAGNELAFTVLYARYQARIYRFALHMSGSVETAEESVQEVFLALIRDPRRFDPQKGALDSYLYGAVRHRILSQFRRDAVLTGLDPDQEAPPPELVYPAEALDDLTRSEKLERLRQAILSLPPSYREIIVLCDLEELDYHDAARALDCPIGTVRSRLHRARAFLAGKLRSPERCLA